VIDATGAAVHLALDHPDPVDVALDGSGAVRQGEAVEHGGVVLFESCGEGVQVGLVVGLDCDDPGVQAVPVQPGVAGLAWKLKVNRRRYRSW
jgi:hypothetical protein